MTFEELLIDNRVKYRTSGEHSSHGWVQFDCPWCGMNSGKFHMGYNQTGRFVHCWKCGWHPIVATLKELIPEIDKKELSAFLNQDELPVQQKRRRGKYKPPTGLGPLEAAHKKYLRKRNFSPAMITDVWKVEGIGPLGNPPWRLFIPVYQREELVAWTSRSLSEAAPRRYVSSSLEHSEVPIKDTLYGLDYCPRTTVIVCEGPLDVWRLGPGAVCTYGVTPSVQQIAQLVDFPRRIVLFDHSQSAQYSADVLCSQLSDFGGTTIRADFCRTDPGDMTDDEVGQFWQWVSDL